MARTRVYNSCIAWSLAFLACMISLSLVVGCRREPDGQPTSMQQWLESLNVAGLRVTASRGVWGPATISEETAAHILELLRLPSVKGDPNKPLSPWGIRVRLDDGPGAREIELSPDGVRIDDRHIAPTPLQLEEVLNAVRDELCNHEELKRLILEGDECQVVARDVLDTAISLGRTERERLAAILDQCLSQDLHWSEGTEASPPVQPYPDYLIILGNNGAKQDITWQGRLVEAETLKFLDTEDLALYRYLEAVLPAPDPLALGDPYTLFYYDLVSIPDLDSKPHVSLIASRVLRAGTMLDAIPDDTGDLWFEAVFHRDGGVSSGPPECKVSVYEHGFTLNGKYYGLNNAGLRCARAVLDAPWVEQPQGETRPSLAQ